MFAFFPKRGCKPLEKKYYMSSSGANLFSPHLDIQILPCPLVLEILSISTFGNHKHVLSPLLFNLLLWKLYSSPFFNYALYR